MELAGKLMVYANLVKEVEEKDLFTREELSRILDEVEKQAKEEAEKMLEEEAARTNV